MKILVINQYFPPDRAATAILLGQLVTSLSQRQHHVHILCASPTYNPDPNLDFQSSENIFMTRIPISILDRSSMMSRLRAYGTFTWGAFRALSRFQKRDFDVILCWSDPPWSSLLAWLASRRVGCPWVWTTQDVYPEIAHAFGKIKNPLTYACLRVFFSWLLKRADHVIAIGSDMEQRLLEKGAKRSGMSLIPNWQDARLIRPESHQTFRMRHKIPFEAFVVMHSGNIGYSQDLFLLLDAANHLQKHQDIFFVVIGDGALKKELETYAVSNQINNVLFLPYQHESDLSSTLSGADVHYVSLHPHLWGYIVPSKFYGITAAGRPILANVPQQCALFALINTHKLGYCVEANVLGLSQCILDLKAHPEFCQAMGQRARAWFETWGHLELAVQAYENCLKSVVQVS